MTQQLKDVYSEEYIQTLAAAVDRNAPKFNSQAFISAVFDEEWSNRELKGRMRHIAGCLREHLPGSYREALAVLVQAAPKFSGFEAMFFPDFVEVYGQDDWEASLPALGAFTEWSSSEFAIRPFILANPERAMAQMKVWAKDPNYHRRRLASEGCRPRLPWAMALKPFQKNPRPIWPILETLKADPERYVTRSVANNLNDITKDHPEAVLVRGRGWQGQHPETDWVIKHGCRTLLKAGHPDALALFGYAEPIGMRVDRLKIEPPSIAIGEAANFSFRLDPGPEPPVKLRLEYAIDFVKAKGSTSRKVFKISESDYEGQAREISRRHDFRQRTTRTHYPGEHRLSIIINGHALASAKFNLIAGD